MSIVAVVVLTSASLVSADPPAADDLDVRIDAVLLRANDVLVTSSAGIFWADLNKREWQKLRLPPEMPSRGRFGSVPEGSRQILYYSIGGYREAGHRPGLYGSTDAGRTWQLLSENDDYGPVAMLENGALFAVTNAGQVSRKAVIEVSHDMGVSWRNITGNSFGQIYGLFPDPDHAGLICIEANSVRNYILQSDDDRYVWKATRSWEWHPERAEKVPFGRSYSTSATRNPLYMFPATLRNYFEHDFGNRASIPAIDLRADEVRFTFRAREKVAIPITVRFLEDMRFGEWNRKQNLANGKQAPELTPTVEKLVDHPTNLGLWGLRVEFRGERTSKQPAIAAAINQIRDEDFAARIRGEPGRQAERQGALIGGLKADPGWKTIEFSSAKPYQRMLDIGTLYEFSEPGDYRLQVDYDSTWLADREQGQWVGNFSSPVFSITIQPRN